MTSTDESSKGMTDDVRPSEEALLAEYGEVGENWRFFIGLRAAIFGVFLTVTSTLVAVAGWGITGEIPIRDVRILRLLGAMAIAFLVGIAMTEYRIWRLFQISLARGIELEQRLSIGRGQYWLFKQSETSPKGRLMVVTYTRAMLLIYLLVLGLWVYLILFSQQILDHLVQLSGT